MVWNLVGDLHTIGTIEWEISYLAGWDYPFICVNKQINVPFYLIIVDFYLPPL